MSIIWGEIEPNFEGVEPCDGERMARLVLNNGLVSEGKVSYFDWSADTYPGCISSYQLEVYQLEVLLEKDEYNAYFKDVSHLNKIDHYRVCDLFEVTDHAIGHAIKKLLLCGVRTGGKDAVKEITEARDTLTRKLEMLEEDSADL